MTMENGPSDQDITYGLISAVREGNLEEARELINSFGLSYSQKWSQGFILLRHALRNKHAAVAKLLLTNDSEVNGETKKPLDTPLHLAVMNGGIEIVNMILEKGANIEARNESGQTPFHVAIKRGSLQIAEELLKYGADINCRCIIWKKDYTPLHLAVEQGDTYADVVIWLLYTGATVNVQGEDNMTPLHIAAKNGCIRIAKYLLSYGVCIHSSTSTGGYTPLHFASKLDNEETMQLLLDRGADVNARTKDDSTPLHIAIKREHEKVVKLLLQHGAKVDHQDKDSESTLYLAIERGNSIIVKEILKYRPDTNNLSNKSSLKLAVRGDGEEYKKIVEALLEYGFIVDPENANDSYFLHAAVRKGYLKIVEGLLKNGADINASDEYGRTALHFTVEGVASDDSVGEIVKLLLSQGAHVDARTKNSRTALYTAIKNGYAKVVEILLDYNANVISGERSDVTPLHLLPRRENAKITRILLNRGANINAEQDDGSTPLHIAARNGHKEIVKVLLEGGAKVDSKRKNGTTPLHLGAQVGSLPSFHSGCLHAASLQRFSDTADATQMVHMEIIEALLEFGADINSRDEWGKTALHLASGEGHNKVVATLLEHGSDINITSRDNDTPLDYAMAKIRALARQRCYGNDDDFHRAQRYFSSRLGAVVETLERHIVKMKIANLCVSEQNLLLISNNDGISNFQDECEREIASMKSEKIDNANVSFYDMLVKDTSSLARYMRNENILQVSKLDTYKAKFPIYAGMIERNSRTGMQKKELLERGNKSLHILFNNLPKLSPECVEKISNYFSDEDLRKLIDTFKPPGINDPYANDVVIP